MINIPRMDTTACLHRMMRAPAECPDVSKWAAECLESFAAERAAQNNLSRHIASLKDDLITQAINRVMAGKPWTPEGLRGRLGFVIPKEQDREIYTLDGTPLIEIHALKFAESVENHAVKIDCAFNYRFLVTESQ